MHTEEKQMRSTSTIVGAGLLALGVSALATPGLAQTDVPARSGGPHPTTGSEFNNRGRDYPAWGAPGAVVPPDETTGSGIRDREFRPRGVDMPSEAPNLCLPLEPCVVIGPR